MSSANKRETNRSLTLTLFNESFIITVQTFMNHPKTYYDQFNVKIIKKMWKYYRYSERKRTINIYRTNITCVIQ